MNAVLYGSVHHRQGHWAVACQPHVRARLKRLFPRAPQHAAEVIEISDTPENTRDLEWFLQRYPMEVSDRELMTARSQVHVDMERDLFELLSSRRELPEFELAFPPRDYQRVAAQLNRIRGGLLLADDLGLGKTVTSICNMADPAHLPVVVVCPSHMPDQWAREINKFAPQLKVHIVRTGKPYPLTKSAGGRQKDMWDTEPDVLIFNYHKLRGWAESLAGKVRYVVFDECQQLRYSGSAIYKACSLLARKAELRVGLSATPIYNYGSEFFWVVDALIPGALGEHDEFLREWCTPLRDGKASITDTERFGAYLRSEGILLRRTRAEVGRELPPLTKIVHHIDADTDVLDRITGDAVNLARTILAHNEKFRGQKMQAAGEFDMLVRQATGVAKAPYVAEFVRMLMESGQRVLLFGWHREVYSIWLEKLSDLKPVMFTGSESPKQKEKALAAFMSGESRLLIMSLRAGAGVDGLQEVCSTAVFGELDWSPGVHEQCTGRPHRDGQTEPVMAYYLVTDEGSDPIVMDVLGVKREQIEGVRNPGLGMAERVDLGESQIKVLAEAFLTSRGEHVDRQVVSLSDERPGALSSPSKRAGEQPAPAGF
jgi:SNF2 family DNA or RNA helicase